jgi:hypothetical protein
MVPEFEIEPGLGRITGAADETENLPGLDPVADVPVWLWA